MSVVPLQPSLPAWVLSSVLPALRQSLRQTEAALLTEAAAAGSNAAQNRWLENAARLRLGRLRLDDVATVALQGGVLLPSADTDWYARFDLDAAMQVVQQQLSSAQTVLRELSLPDVGLLARAVLDWCRWQQLDAGTSLRVFQAFRHAVLDAWPAWCRQWAQSLGRVWPESTEVEPTQPEMRPLPVLLETLQQQQAVLFRQQDVSALAQTAALNVHAALTQAGYTPSAAEAETLALIDRLFGFMVQAGKLAAAVQGVLLGLQLPITRVAFAQDDFFSRSGHPARLFLNQLAAASLALDDGNLHDDAVFQAMRAAVQRVLDDQPLALGLFATVLADFSDVLERQSEQALLAEERLRGAEVAGAQQAERHQQVDAELAVFLAEPALPEVLRQFLSGSWRKVLLLVAQQAEAARGDKEQQYRQLMRDLVWSVQPIAGPADRQRLLKTVPGLLKQLRTALTWAGQGQAETEAFFQALEAIHLAQLRGKPVPEAVVATVAAAAPLPVDAPSLEACYAQVDGLSMGVWVEFHDGETRLRCKLAAVIRHTGRFVFVNRSGSKVADKNRDELAADVRDGRVVLLEDMQLFDRALASVIDNTRQRRQ